MDGFKVVAMIFSVPLAALAFPARLKADQWNRIGKSSWRLLAALLALALALPWAPAARATSFAAFDAASPDRGNGHKKGHQANKHKKDDDRDEHRDQDRNRDRDERERETDHRGGKHQGGVHATAPVFGPRDRDTIGRYYRDRYSNLPPGLAKRGGNLPPGLQRQLERNGTLPPGLQKRLDPFPPELSGQLPPLPPGYTRGVIGGSAVILNTRTGAIVDIIHNILNRSGM